MDYSLAKRLQEAGFPQGTVFGMIWNNPEQKIVDEHIEREAVNRKVLEQTDPYPINEFIAAPTLLELLIWCGPEFRHLSRYEEHENEIWKASAVSGGENVVCQGATPEVAVALLGLALHKVEEGGPRMPYPTH